LTKVKAHMEAHTYGKIINQHSVRL